MGTTMTAEKVPSGGDAHGGGNGGGEGGGNGDEPSSECLEIEVGKGDCAAVIDAIKALKKAGATVHCVKVNGNEVSLDGKKKPNEGGEGGEHHEGGEEHNHDYEAGGEHEKE